MLNKELIMVGGESLEPVLSIYISPELRYLPSVSGELSSVEPLFVSKTGGTTFKFSEVNLDAVISVSYYEDMQLFVSNLTPAPVFYSGGAERAASSMLEYFSITDRTKSALISIV